MNFNVEGACARSCGSYTKTKHLNCADDTMCTKADNTDREKIVCDGDIRDCTDTEINGNIEINISSGDENRRYASIEFYDKRFMQKSYGPKSHWAYSLTVICGDFCGQKGKSNLNLNLSF